MRRRRGNPMPDLGGSWPLLAVGVACIAGVWYLSQPKQQTAGVQPTPVVPVVPGTGATPPPPVVTPGTSPVAGYVAEGVVLPTAAYSAGRPLAGVYLGLSGSQTEEGSNFEAGPWAVGAAMRNTQDRAMLNFRAVAAVTTYTVKLVFRSSSGSDKLVGEGRVDMAPGRAADGGQFDYQLPSAPGQYQLLLSLWANGVPLAYEAPLPKYVLTVL